ncbi:tetratricopeptide repeat protein [bacterium]|nr:tetratricopeptide repeat protein [bacterium]
MLHVSSGLSPFHIHCIRSCRYRLAPPRTSPYLAAMRTSKHSTILTAVVVFTVALVVRAAYLWAAHELPTFVSPGMDAQIYREWADQLLRGQEWNEPYFRAPGYPCLLAALASLTGAGTFWPVRILQVLLSASGAFLLARLAGRWFTPAAAWFAGLAWALYGASVYFDGEGLIAGLYAALTIFLLYTLDLYRRSEKQGGRWGYMLLAALLLGLLTTLRANALAWWPVLLVVLWFQPGLSERTSARRPLTQVVVALLLMLLLVFPILRHNVMHGGGVAISTQGGINLYLGNNVEASGAHSVDPKYGPTWTREQITRRAEQALGRPLSHAEVDEYYRAQAVQFWTEHPGQAAALTWRKVRMLLNAREIGNNRVLHPYLRGVGRLFHLLVLIGFPLVAVPGLAAAVPLWRRFPPIRPALALAAVHLLTLLPFFITARYRFPVAPMLILSASGLFFLLRDWKSQDRAMLRNNVTLISGALLAALWVFAPSPLPSTSHSDDWAFHQGNALLRLGRYDEAIPRFYEALRSNPTHRSAHLNIGVCRLHAGHLDSAQMHFLRQWKLTPGNVNAANNLGAVAERQSRLDEALEWYHTAYRADPTHEDARLNYARLLHDEGLKDARAGRLQQAEFQLSRASRLVPENPTYAHNLALVQAAQGNITEAIETVETLLRRHPHHQPSQGLLRELEAGSMNR